MKRICALMSLAVSLCAAGTGAAATAGWPACGPDEVVRYSLDQHNVTGWRHDLMRPIPEEVAWFDDNGDLVIERDGEAIRYVTSGGGSGLRQRVGRSEQLPEDDPAASVGYIFYDLSVIAAEGRPDQILMIDGDIFWPSCPER